jgi:glyoxylase-like metal-dependent hydrolase (beta-lactamase superfamily II)
MAEVPLRPESIVSMQDIAPGVAGLRIAFVNVFGVSHGTGAWTLVDAGIPFSAAYIRKWADEQFGVPPVAIVLTHGHFDHVSAAGELAGEWNCPIYAHVEEFPYLTGKLSYPKPNVGAGGGLMSWLSPLYPRGPVDVGQRLRPFEDEESSPSPLPGWQVIHTPGHTPGHVSFFRPSDRVLLAGDAFCTTRPESFFEAALVQQAELHGPPAYFTWNADVAAESIVRLASFEPAVLAPGHGKPLAGQEVAAKLERFAREFEREHRAA